MLYFSIYDLDCDAGIMLTGSHNPKNHNGFKIGLKERPFYGDDIVNLAKIAADGDFEPVFAEILPVVVNAQTVDQFIKDHPESIQNVK